eukprot:208153_1
MNFERHKQSYDVPIKHLRKARRSSTTVLEIQKLQKHPILLTFGSFCDQYNEPTTKHHRYETETTKPQTLSRSLSITQLEVNHRIRLINTSLTNTKPKPRRPSSARSSKCKTKTSQRNDDKIRLKKLKWKRPAKRRPMSAGNARNRLNPTHNNASIHDLWIQARNNKQCNIRKPITVVTTKTPQGSFMIQTKQNIANIEEKTQSISPLKLTKPKKKKKSKRPSSAHHIVLKHERRESIDKSTKNAKSKLIEHIYYMEKRPIKFKFRQSNSNYGNDKKESMWKLMMKNGRQERQEALRVDTTAIKQTKMTSDNSTSDLIGDMFVRHHSPKFKRKPRSVTTDEMDFELNSPSKRAKKLVNQKESKKIGARGAAFVVLMRAKLRVKQKRNLEKLKKELMLKYIANTPTNRIHPDEYIKPLSKKCKENQSKISECLAVFGRKRMRILTYIFKHIDFKKIGEISFECVMQFDLLLIPNATQEMIEEDANLFFKFSGLSQRPWMNMLDWIVTWKLAVQKSGSFKVIDNFLNQYFETFREAKFRLSVIGVTWP